MKNIIGIYITTVCLLLACSEDNIKDLSLVIRSSHTASSPVSEWKCDADYICHVDTARIGEVVKFDLSLKSATSIISNLKITVERNDLETVMLDTALDFSQDRLIFFYHVSEEEGIETWKFTVTNDKGEQLTKEQTIRTIETGIHDSWSAIYDDKIYGYFSKYSVVNLFFIKEDAQDRFVIRAEGYVDSGVYERIKMSGTYAQEKQDPELWKITLYQDVPEQKTYTGIFKLFTPGPLKGEFKFVQTAPDIGLAVPTDFEISDNVKEGSFHFIAVQFHFIPGK